MTQKDEEDLRLWLRRREFGLLLQVIDAQVKRYEALALNTALESSEVNVKLEQANVHLDVAKQWAVFANLAKELAAQSSTFTLAKLT